MAPMITPRGNDGYLGPEFKPIIIAVPTVILSLVVLTSLIACFFRRQRRRSKERGAPEDASASASLNKTNNDDEEAAEMQKKSGDLRRDWKEWEANLRRDKTLSIESHPALNQATDESTPPELPVPSTSPKIPDERELRTDTKQEGTDMAKDRATSA